MLSIDAEYQHVSGITKYKSDLIHSAFDQFTKVFTAIVGGSIWLSRQKDLSVVSRENFEVLSNATVIILTFYTVASVADDFRSWHGYRQRLAQIGEQGGVDPKIPPAKIWPSAIKPILMIIAAFSAMLIFWRFNPFI